MSMKELCCEYCDYSVVGLLTLSIHVKREHPEKCLN